MLGLGINELIFICVLIFLLFGPKGLPLVAKTFAKFLYEMKHIFQQLEQEWKINLSEKSKNVNSHDKK